MPHTVQSRPPADTPSERAPFRVVLGKVSLLLVVAFALSASVRSAEGLSDAARGGTHARDAVRLITTTAQQAARRLAQRDQVKPISLTPGASPDRPQLVSGELRAPASEVAHERRLLRPETLDLPPPSVA